MLAGVNGAGKNNVVGALLLNEGGQFYNPHLYAHQFQIIEHLGIAFDDPADDDE